MDQNPNQQNYLPEEEKPVSPPPPPAPQIGIRTMQSDIESIQQSGGEGATPQVFIPEELEPKRFQPQEPEPDAVLNVPGYTGSEKPIFESRPTISANQPFPTSTLQPQTEKSPVLKTVILITATIILIAGLGLLGYYVIFPLLF